MSNTNEETLNEASETQDAATPDVVVDDVAAEAAAVKAANEEAETQDVAVEAATEDSPTAEAVAVEAVAVEAVAAPEPEAEAAVEAVPAEETAPEAEAASAVEASAEETPAEMAPAEVPVAESKGAPEASSDDTTAKAANSTTEEAAEPGAAEAASAEAAPAEAAAAKAVSAKATAAKSAGGKGAKVVAAPTDGKGATVVAAAATDGGAEAEPDATMLMLEKALADKSLVKGQVIGWNKGGYHVAIEKIAAFCPVSQIEIGNPRSPKRYLDKSFEFRVLEIQKGGRRVVLSRAEALKAEREARAKLVRERLKAGEILEGKVTSITSFGAFVDLGGGIEGLVHISELSRRRVEHPKELVQVGREVKVTVLKIEKGGQRISLSMKRLEDDPWEGVADRFPPGGKFSGKILRKTDFGMFIELEPGLEGLVHLSRLPLGMTMESEGLDVGTEIEVWVHEVESKRRRLSLSMREVVGGNPWKSVGERFPEGEIVTGTVERLTNFGVFIELEPGLTGLLPFAAIPGIANPRRKFHPGKEVPVRILSIDTGRKRISLGTENSKAEGSPQDYREYQKKSQAKGQRGGMNALAAAFAKLKDDAQVDQQ